MESNQMKMREALETINCIDTRGLKRLLCELVEADIFDGGLINKTISAVEKARCALSAPERNCDVGSVEEQSKRFRDFCKIESSASGGRCTGCRAICYGKNKCEFAWAQLPYAAEEGGAE